ncbi:hypothetical protein, partial [Brucella pseudintermedia]|uniref:hypothetical protein n=1 Tax=Brucella pseudintermedia TaxID=370111 RepID=UPI001AD7A636
QNLNLPKLRDDLVGLVSLVCHCGPPSWSKPYFKVDPFNGGGSAYIERKLRDQYRDDPIAVERGLEAARTKIAGMIARGNEIEAPSGSFFLRIQAGSTCYRALNRSIKSSMLRLSVPS